MLSWVPVPLRQGVSKGDLLNDDSKNKEAASPTNGSYSSRDHKERISHWAGNVVKTVLEGIQVGTQNCVNRPQEGHDNESEAHVEMISVCKLGIHLTDWVKVKSEDQYILIVVRWIEGKKNKQTP